MDTKKRRIFFVGVVALALLLLGVFLLLVHPPCLIYAATGLQCPGCGTTRMVQALLRRDFAAAFRLNAFMCFFLPVSGVWLFIEAVRYVQGKKPLLYRRWAVVFWSAMFCAALVFAVWRNLAVV